ncbi:VOC family protein [Streptomyces canus]|uniref:VOC family protein n=1 Tax=Streptomyces canus TaxID=58343 RepID=UPI003673D1A2
MDFVSIRIITSDVARLVDFYERATGVRATWATEDFAELKTPGATPRRQEARTYPDRRRLAVHGVGTEIARASKRTGPGTGKVGYTYLHSALDNRLLAPGRCLLRRPRHHTNPPLPHRQRRALPVYDLG